MTIQVNQPQYQKDPPQTRKRHNRKRQAKTSIKAILKTKHEFILEK